MFALTADQRDSQSSGDDVPLALETLSRPSHAVLGFERTTGDEIQGLLASGGDVVRVVQGLTRLGNWWIGIGIGDVDMPLPPSTREARGPAYVAARSALERARASRVPIAVGGFSVDKVELAESALIVLVELLSRRSPEGWFVADRIRQGKTQREIAAELGISHQAVSQRLRASNLDVTEHSARLAEVLLDDADGRPR